MADTVGATMRFMILSRISGVTAGAGETAPMPPVLGPAPPSPAVL